MPGAPHCKRASDGRRGALRRQGQARASRGSSQCRSVSRPGLTGPSPVPEPRTAGSDARILDASAREGRPQLPFARWLTPSSRSRRQWLRRAGGTATSPGRRTRSRSSSSATEFRRTLARPSRQSRREASRAAFRARSRTRSPGTVQAPHRRGVHLHDELCLSRCEARREGRLRARLGLTIRAGAAPSHDDSPSRSPRWPRRRVRGRGRSQPVAGARPSRRASRARRPAAPSRSLGPSRARSPRP